MKLEENNQTVESFLTQCNDICNVTKTATRNKKSLSGANFYGDKFHNLLVEVLHSVTQIQKLITIAGFENGEGDKFTTYVEILKSTTTTPAKKTEALKQLRLFCKSELLPRLENLTANPVPLSEQILPMAVVQNTHSYLEKVVLQANGCYEHQWYDACAVLIRRLVETLIIELYEAKGKATEIQDRDGNFWMLNVLVTKVIAEPSWNLGRETKAALPLLKNLGDRSAHNRRFFAMKADIDKVLPGLRVVADDLLHLSGLK